MSRFLDIIFSLSALALLSPLLIIIVVILKVTGEGEIFYVQKRAGKKGNSFGLIKFATMLKNSPNIGAGEITVQNDPRVLPFGRFLRKTKINELPQLWNILIGEMSVVGPRPMVLNTYAYYPESVRLKLDTIRPGLTGIGSIVFRDEESYLAKSARPMEFYRENIIPYKSQLELWFLEHNTLWVYIKIIVITVWVVIIPSSKIVEKAFKDLPKVPDSLI